MWTGLPKLSVGFIIADIENTDCENDGNLLKDSHDIAS